MSNRIELDLPKFGIAERTKDGLLVRLGPPGHILWYAIPINVLVFGWCIYMCFLSPEASFLICPFVVLYSAYSQKVYWPAIGHTLELSKTHLILIDHQNNPMRIETSQVRKLEYVDRNALKSKVRLLNDQGQVLALLPASWGWTSSIWLAALALPTDVPFSKHEPLRRNEQFVRFLLGICSLGIGILFTLLVRMKNDNLRAERQTFQTVSELPWDVPLLSIASFAFLSLGFYVLYTCIFKPKPKMDPFLGFNELFSSQRTIFKGFLGSLAPTDAREYIFSIPRQFEQQKRIEGKIRLEVIFLSLLVLTFFFSPLGVFVRGLETSSELNVTDLVLGAVFGLLIVCLLKIYDSILERLKSGYQSNGILLNLSESPSLDGMPIERVRLNLAPHRARERHHLPSFPDTITAGGKTYRVNFLYFKPARQSDKREA